MSVQNTTSRADATNPSMLEGFWVFTHSGPKPGHACAPGSESSQDSRIGISDYLPKTKRLLVWIGALTLNKSVLSIDLLHNVSITLHAKSNLLLISMDHVIDWVEL
jgi:hypothetical protein